MVDGELGAFPAALAKQRQMVEVHAFGAALAMVQAMDPEQAHGAPQIGRGEFRPTLIQRLVEQPKRRGADAPACSRQIGGAVFGVEHRGEHDAVGIAGEGAVEQQLGGGATAVAR